MTEAGPATLDEARREIARLRALAEVNAQSALMQSIRASARAIDAQAQAQAVQTIRRSTSWRLTLPLRAAVFLLTRGPREGVRLGRIVRTVAAREGWSVAAAKIKRRLRQRVPGLRRAPAARPAPEAAAPLQATAILAPRVLIIAELSIPQCAKYRVWQKQEHFRLLGTECTVLDWHNTEACRSALQVHAQAIFYRVPGYAPVLGLIDEAKRLGLETYWEADDLIFDIEEYKKNSNLATLTKALRREVLDGIALYRTAMLACDRTIASTAALAEAMRASGAGPSTVVENALDEETLRAAEAIRAGRRKRDDGRILIAYGSGTKTHDADFAVAAPALAEIMRQRGEVGLRLIGDLTLPKSLEPFLDRIERLPGTGYVPYLGLLAEADITIAPLENTRFNDAKSNIKFLEASMLALPSVCSPRANFRTVMRHGENGLMAEDPAEWRDALLRLIEDEALRRRLAEAALHDVLARYSPQKVAEQQLAPLVAGLDARRRPALRVLAVNIFFAPTSFGGATVVAEEMAKRLHARDDTDMFVFTSREDDSPQYTLRRYDVAGMPVVSVRLPGHDPIAEFDNPEMALVFADVLRAVQPDVVHFHCLQVLSAALPRACAEAGIPYVVTVHDAWWICARQFMVTGEGAYCFQTKIDLTVCEACVPGAPYVRPRFNMLTHALGQAALVLSPSEAHRQLYLANGFRPERTLVNQNGIRLPSRPRLLQTGDRLRFGFVGGNFALKGYDQLRQAFEQVEDRNYTLVMVDSTLKLGYRSLDAMGWRVRGKIEIVPPYDQDGLDAFFDGIDVLLFPSQWKESFGLIVAEALARDVWVVVTEGGGAAEFVVDGENGTVIPLQNDPKPLLQAIERLLAEPSRLKAHVNPYKSRLHGYDEQAQELHGLLLRVDEASRQADRLPSPGGRGSNGSVSA